MRRRDGEGIYTDRDAVSLLFLHRPTGLRRWVRMAIQIAREGLGRLFGMRGTYAGIDESDRPLALGEKPRMSLVTFGDRAKALQMLGNDTAPFSTRDRMLFSLARKTTWTDRQRAIIDRMWIQWEQRRDLHRTRSASRAVS